MRPSKRWKIAKFKRDFWENMIGWLIRIFCEKPPQLGTEYWYRIRFRGFIIDFWYKENTQYLMIRVTNKNGLSPAGIHLGIMEK